MAARRIDPKVALFRPRTNDLEQVIRNLAAGRISPGFSEHALDRMDERGITTLDVVRVLRTGGIKGEIGAGRAAGEWKCKVVAKIKGSREIGVITIVVAQQRLFVKTVEWEDL